jgi:hypothetical protein
LTFATYTRAATGSKSEATAGTFLSRGSEPPEQHTTPIEIAIASQNFADTVHVSSRSEADI